MIKNREFAKKSALVLLSLLAVALIEIYQPQLLEDWRIRVLIFFVFSLTWKYI